MPKDVRTLNEIIHAIQTNNLEELRHIFETRLRRKERTFACISEADDKLLREYENVILVAARLEDPAILKYLISTGININYTGESPNGKCRVKVCPLHVAINNGLHNTVSMLVESNADINKSDHQGRAPLHLATKRADCELVRMLLCRGANIAMLDKKCTSCLQMAAKYGHVELVRILLEHNAQIFHKGQVGASPLHIAAWEGHVPLIDLFSRYVDVNILCDIDGDAKESALHLAAERGIVETVQFLVDKLRADVNILDSAKRSPLHCLLSRPHDHKRMRRMDDFDMIADFLIKRGTVVSSKDRSGDTPLHLAARHNFHKIANFLLYAGGDRMAKNKQGSTPHDGIHDYDVQMKQIFAKYPVVSTPAFKQTYEIPTTPPADHLNQVVPFMTPRTPSAHAQSLMTQSFYHYDNVTVDPSAPIE